MRATAIGKTAWTGLSRHRQRTFLMMIGIVVGVGVAVLLGGQREGERREEHGGRKRCAHECLVRVSQRVAGQVVGR